jgi:hypothetical protein
LHECVQRRREPVDEHRLPRASAPRRRQYPGNSQQAPGLPPRQRRCCPRAERSPARGCAAALRRSAQSAAPSAPLRPSCPLVVLYLVRARCAASTASARHSRACSCRARWAPSCSGPPRAGLGPSDASAPRAPRLPGRARRAPLHPRRTAPRGRAVQTTRAAPRSQTRSRAGRWRGG